MLIIEFLGNENGRSEPFRWSLATMDSPDPEPTLSLVQQKKTKRELIGEKRQQIVSRLLFEMQHSGIEGKFLRDTLMVNGASFMWLGEQLAKYGRMYKNFFRIQLFVNFVPAPGKRRSVDDSRTGANHDEIREAVTHHTPFLREGPPGSLRMLLECRNHYLE